MKKICLTIILLSNIFAQTFADTAQRRTPTQQNKLTLIGGLNLGTIEYNNSQLNDLADIQYRAGANLAVEITQGKMKLGAAFIQRGGDLSLDMDGITLSGYDVINYIAIYGLLPVVSQQGFTASAGFQAGKMISGKTKMTLTDTYNLTGYGYGYSETMSQDLETEYFNIDYGLIVAADFKITSQIGIRGSYYIGLGDVLAGFPGGSDDNYKHRGIGIDLLYKR